MCAKIGTISLKFAWNRPNIGLKIQKLPLRGIIGISPYQPSLQYSNLKSFCSSLDIPSANIPIGEVSLYCRSVVTAQKRVGYAKWVISGQWPDMTRESRVISGHSRVISGHFTIFHAQHMQWSNKTLTGRIWPENWHWSVMTWQLTLNKINSSAILGQRQQVTCFTYEDGCRHHCSSA